MSSLKNENNIMGGCEKPYFCASFDGVTETGMFFEADYPEP